MNSAITAMIPIKETGRQSPIVTAMQPAPAKIRQNPASGAIGPGSSFSHADAAEPAIEKAISEQYVTKIRRLRPTASHHTSTQISS